VELRSSADVLAVRRKTESEYTSYEVSAVFGDPRQRDDGPQVFLVRQAPLGVTPAHFHCVPQFQVFVDGDGTIGKHHLAPTALHYVDPWTTYGPIASGEAGISYFTARMDPDVGAHYMPGARAEKREKSGRAFTIALDQPTNPYATARETPAGGTGTLTSLIPRQEDGLAAFVTDLTPDSLLQFGLIPQHDRRLLIVVRGDLVASDGRVLPAWSWALAPSTDRDPAEFRAGDGGARALVLDYPHGAYPRVGAEA
jgi:hypothetical protein